MKTLFDQTGYIADPHTALALEAAAQIDPGPRHLVTLATAHPAKFAETVTKAIGFSPPLALGRWPAPACPPSPIDATLAAVENMIDEIAATQSGHARNL
jgi:threonine synthase